MDVAQLLIFGAAFLGSAVESVEALTIVLAVGLTRGWRAPLYGTAAALATLAVLVLVFGRLIVAYIPDTTLKLVIGTLLMLFGLRWLHKAVLRSAGVIGLHEEEESFRETVDELKAAAPRDWIGFTLAYKGVFLEGLEVAFIVIAVGGTGGRRLEIAAAGGLLAMLVVALAGFAVRHPLAKVPENLLKYAVGVILTSLGTFWVAEGMGAAWPGDLASIGALIVIYFAASRLAVALIRRPVPA